MAHDIAQVMFDTAVLRSGYTIPDSVSFAKRILKMMYSNMDIDPNTPVSLLIFINESFTFFLQYFLLVAWFTLREKCCFCFLFAMINSII